MMTSPEVERCIVILKLLENINYWNNIVSELARFGNFYFHTVVFLQQITALTTGAKGGIWTHGSMVLQTTPLDLSGTFALHITLVKYNITKLK